ncbi:MAG: VOC family protein [Paracoccaceae bacterium]
MAGIELSPGIGRATAFQGPQSAFGAIVQMGYVVADLDAALDHWTRVMGVGPFLVTPRIDYAELTWRGRPIRIENAVALASHRGMQIELIQQTGGDPSMFTEFVRRRGGGLHHVCVLSQDIVTDLAAWAQAGTGVLMGGRTAAGIPFAYLDSDPADEGRVVEIVQPTPGLTKFFARLDHLAANWDGSDPVRRL